MKYIITESQYDKMIDRFISSQFEPHNEKTTPKYSNSIFWIKNGEVIAEIIDSEYFWVKENVWDIISNMPSLKENETRQSISLWLEEHYNLGELTPKIMWKQIDYWKGIKKWNN
jgi:hypothetical protein